MNNLSGDEIILVKISNSISQKVNILLNQIKVIRKGSLKPLNPDSGETAGTKALGPRDGRAKSDDDFKKISDAEKFEWVKKKLEEGGEEKSEESGYWYCRKKIKISLY